MQEEEDKAAVAIPQATWETSDSEESIDDNGTNSLDDAIELDAAATNLEKLKPVVAEEDEANSNNTNTTKTKTALRWLRRFIQYSLLCFLLVVLVLWVGALIQQRKVDQEAALQNMQNTNKNDTEFCQVTHTAPNVTFSTISGSEYENTANTTNTNNNNTRIAHCGGCGQCSNPHDVGVYAATTGSLYSDTARCAKQALGTGRSGARKCLQSTVGFTDDCSDCWVDNIMCDLTQCIFVCLWHGMWSSIDSGNGNAGNPTALNPCTHCDEVRCGPAFVTCAGANRRRSGILSDIKRADNQVCAQAAPEWYWDADLVDDWESSNPPQQEQVNEQATARHGLRRH